MINSMMHSYLILNAAIAIGYFISKTILFLPALKQKMSQAQRLTFARYSFLAAVLVFLLIPYVLAVIPSTYHNNYQLEPIIKNASMALLQQKNEVAEQINQMHYIPSFISLNLILTGIFSIGWIIAFSRYIHHLFILRKLKNNSFLQHKINNVNILISATAEVPFCWSMLKNHYIAIPSAFLEKSNDLKLAIRHELQHIRQGDTYWLHFISITKTICFLNPFMKLWMNWFDELQEFSCDETIVLRKNTSPIAYAECLVNSTCGAFNVPQGALGIHGLSQSILYRRVNMLFHYKKSSTRKISTLLAYLVLFFSAASAAYAINGSANRTELSKQEVQALINKSHLNTSFQVTATPEVVDEINHIRGSDHARSFLRDSLTRMKQYQPVIQDTLKKEAMPIELLAVPLVESGYRPLDQSKNRVLAAGIWQIIPATGKQLNLVINDKQDDRLNTILSTNAAVTYLKLNYKQFNNWKLAVIAYEIGEEQTAKLIKNTHSRDPWVIAHSSAAPAELKKLIARFDAELIIMRNPALVD